MKQETFYSIPKNPTTMGGVRWMALLAGIIVVLFFSCIATQYLAFHFSYDKGLGNSLFCVGKTCFYAPFKWLSWIWQWRDISSQEVKSYFVHCYGIMLSGMMLSLGLMVMIIYRHSRSFDTKLDDLHGSAHWASEKEIAQTGLLHQRQGVYVGGWIKPYSDELCYLRHDGPEHVIAIAPTRSGKGVGLVLPTLLSWPHSVLVYDIKGENWALTSGWRKRCANNRVIKFEPGSTEGSASFNPLNEIRLRTEKEIADIQNIATMIVDPDGKGLVDHWQKTGHALLVGAILHVLYIEKDKTLRGVASFLSNPSRPFEQTLLTMLEAQHDPTLARKWRDSSGIPIAVHPVVAESSREMLNKSEQERSGVLSTAMSFLTLYRDPIVAKNTEHSDFTISNIVNHDKPVSLYLVVPASDKDRLKPLIRLLINQIVRQLVEKMAYENGRAISPHRHRLLLLIDEFPSLGKLDIFEESLAFIASYGLKAYLIVQDLSQLQKAYGKTEAIISNCHIRVAYAPNKVETAQVLSDMIGVTTIERGANSYSGSRFSLLLSKVSTSIQPTQRKLLTPDEVMRLRLPEKDGSGNIISPGDMLIFVAGHAPILGKQILYFSDPEFSKRAACAPPETDVLYHRAPQVPAIAVPAQVENKTPAQEVIPMQESVSGDDVLFEEVLTSLEEHSDDEMESLSDHYQAEYE